MTLTNARHERFAQLLAEGITQIEAYKRAGYRGRAESHVARLVGRDDIRARVATYLESDRLSRTGITHSPAEPGIEEPEAEPEPGSDLGPVSKAQPIEVEPQPKRRESKLDKHRVEIEALIAAGHSVHSIEKHFEVTHGAIRYWLKSQRIAYTPKPRSKLDPHRVEIEALIAAGHSVHSIEKRFEVTHDAIRYWLKSRGVAYTPKPRSRLDPYRVEIEAQLAEGYSHTMIGKRFEVTGAAVRYWLKSRRVAYTPGPRSKLVPHRVEIEALIAAGHSRNSIAKRLGFSDHTIKKWLKIWGITYTWKGHQRPLPKRHYGSRLDKHRAEIEAQLAEGRSVSSISRHCNTSGAHLRYWIRTRLTS